MKKLVLRPISFAIALILALSFAMLTPLPAGAAVYDTFIVDGVTFMILTEEGDTGTVQVGNGTKAAINIGTTGAVTIPQYVTSGEKTYEVTFIGNKAFKDCTELTGATIPNGVTGIGSEAFRFCNSLTDITLPDSVKSIGMIAFSFTGLRSITIPNGVTSIDYQTFYSCTSLTSVTIPNRVSGIGSNAFSNCTNLTSVTIGNFVYNISSDAFGNCPNLSTIIVAPENNYFSSEDGILFNKTKTTLLRYPTASGEYDIPDSVTRIGDSAFDNCAGLTRLNIHDRVSYIGNKAFSGCTGLTSIYFSDKPPFVGSLAFENLPSGATAYVYSDAGFITGDDGKWNGLNVVRIVRPNVGGIFTVDDIMYKILTEDGLTGTVQVGNGTIFPEFYVYGAITIPQNVTSGGKTYTVTFIGDNAFHYFTELTSVTIPDSVMGIGIGVFVQCDELTNVTIGNGVTSIGGYAFFSCDKLKSVTIPDNVTSIDYQAFAYCTALTNVSLGSGLTHISEKMFEHCTELTSVTIPDNVTSIDDYAFVDCTGLTSITIGSGVSSISSKAFVNCPNLKTIIVAPDNNYYSSEGGVLFDKTKTTLIRYPTASGAYIIPSGVTSIGDYAFDNCAGLTSVTIPDGVMSIGEVAFNNCESLTSVTIGSGVAILSGNAFLDCPNITQFIAASDNSYFSSEDGILFNKTKTTLVCYPRVSGAHNVPGSVTSIGDYAFYGCTGLTGVTIPGSVTSIGDYAFYGCTGLTGMAIPSTSIGDYAFYECTGLTGVTIHDSVSSIGDYAFYGCTGLSNLVIPGSVISIGEWAFRGCIRLSSIYFDGDEPVVGSNAFDSLPYYATAYVYSDAVGFKTESDGKWKGLHVKWVDRAAITSLSIGAASTLVSGREATIPITLTGTGLDGRQLTFSIIDAGGNTVSSGWLSKAANSFSYQIRIDMAGPSFPAGSYTFRVSVQGTDVKADVPLKIAPNSADYWDMSVLKGSYDSGDALEIRFPDVGYERQLLGEVFVNNVKYSAVTAGNSLFVPSAPLSGELIVKVTGIKYPVLFPSYRFTFTKSTAL